MGASEYCRISSQEFEGERRMFIDLGETHYVVPSEYVAAQILEFVIRAIAETYPH